MSAHFDGGAEIEGRRLREVEVTYVDDPTLDLDGHDSDDCPASPPPTYYLRVRENKPRAASPSASFRGKEDSGSYCKATDTREQSSWAWRYVNVEKRTLLVWSRRGGKLLRSIPLRDVQGLAVVPDQDAPASILEVRLASSPRPEASANSCGSDTRDEEINSRRMDSGCERRNTDGGDLILQAKSRRETLLWAKVLQENVEIMTKRRIALDNQDQETSLSDVQQLAKLLTHQLSELQASGINDNVERRHCGASDAPGARVIDEGSAEGIEREEGSC